jgi:hypothetical protein
MQGMDFMSAQGTLDYIHQTLDFTSEKFISIMLCFSRSALAHWGNCRMECDPPEPSLRNLVPLAIHWSFLLLMLCMASTNCWLVSSLEGNLC